MQTFILNVIAKLPEDQQDQARALLEYYLLGNTDTWRDPEQISKLEDCKIYPVAEFAEYYRNRMEVLQAIDRVQSFMAEEMLENIPFSKSEQELIEQIKAHVRPSVYVMFWPGENHFIRGVYNSYETAVRDFVAPVKLQQISDRVWKVFDVNSDAFLYELHKTEILA